MAIPAQCTENISVTIQDVHSLALPEKAIRREEVMAAQECSANVFQNEKKKKEEEDEKVRKEKEK